ncbi:hypothetical protein [Halorussus caseinilyticus]|uniref:Acetophenone carboxylase-like C-terminal domain-containing protein n=1 Tax=Halorussus caseinilyticus TaxID=3034025 RepID=A0ABD5WT35_9EURY
MGRVVVPRACGVLSAFGLLAADETRDAVRTYRRTLAEADAEEVEAVLSDLADEARADLRDPGSAAISRQADLRYAGQSYELSVEVGASFDPEAVEARFHETHETASGYRMDEAVELVGLRAQATVARETPAVAYEGAGESADDARVGAREATFGGEVRETPVYRRESLPAGESFDGPAVCEQADSTLVVPPGWSAGVEPDGTLVLEGDEGGRR